MIIQTMGHTSKDQIKNRFKAIGFLFIAIESDPFSFTVNWSFNNTFSI